ERRRARLARAPAGRGEDERGYAVAPVVADLAVGLDVALDVFGAEEHGPTIPTASRRTMGSRGAPSPQCRAGRHRPRSARGGLRGLVDAGAGARAWPL